MWYLACGAIGVAVGIVIGVIIMDIWHSRKEHQHVDIDYEP